MDFTTPILSHASSPSPGATLTWIKANMGAASILFPSPMASGAIEMKIWPCTRIALACGAILASVIVTPSARAVDAISLKVRSSERFDLTTYREMEKTDRRTLGLILTAMRETVFYAQQSIGKSAYAHLRRRFLWTSSLSVSTKKLQRHRTHPATNMQTTTN
jgi:hypothetical protein